MKTRWFLPLIPAALILIALVLASCDPYPQDYAAATATVMHAHLIATRYAVTNSIALTAAAGEANATATAVAVRAQGTSTAAAVEVQATSTAIAASAMQTAEAARIIIEATQTAAPYNAALASTNARTEMAVEWAGVAALMAGLALCGMVGLAFVAWLQTRARIVRPGPTGQMPMIWDGHTLVEPNRMIGPAATTPAQADWLIEIARAVHFLRTGKALPPQQAQPALLADGGADADHLLEAARLAEAAATASAIFQPDNAEQGRRAKIELIKKGDSNVLGLLGGPGSSVPTTRIVVTGDSAIEAIARQLGDHLPQQPLLAGPSTFEASGESENELSTGGLGLQT